jgi:RNA polymerase sigma-70 factor, ECF subfamily
MSSAVDEGELAAEWSRRWQAAQARWPDVRLDEESFADYVAARLGDGNDWPMQATHDLYLACACAGGDARAVAALHEGPLREAADALLGRFEKEALADACQAVSLQLIGAHKGGAAGVASYRGNGDLRGWLKVVLTREVLQQMRPEARQQRIRDASSQSLADAVNRLDPEALLLESTYSHAFREAFAAALVSLSQRQQQLLRYYFLERMTIDELGALYRVHRSTVARRVADVRAELLAATRQRLLDKLAVSTEELDSIIRLVDSKLEMTFSQLLAGDVEPR